MDPSYGVLTKVLVVAKLPFLGTWAGRYSFAYFWLVTAVFDRILWLQPWGQYVSASVDSLSWQDRGQDKEFGAIGDFEGMCCAFGSQILRADAPVCCYYGKGGCITPNVQPLQSGRKAWDWLLLLPPPSRAPFFSTFNIWRPSPPIGGVKCVHTFCQPLLLYLSQARVQALPSQPQIGTKVQLGIMGWGAQVTPPYSISLGLAHTSLQGGGWERDGMGGAYRGRDQCSNLPGTPPLPLGL